MKWTLGFSGAIVAIEAVGMPALVIANAGSFTQDGAFIGALCFAFAPLAGIIATGTTLLYIRRRSGDGGT